MTSLRCSSCKRRYELKYWGKHERKNQNSCLKTKLVCKACRAQGFTAWSVEAYTCHTCSCKFGPNKFATFALQNVGIVKYSISWAPWPLKRRRRPEAARRCLRGDVCTEMSAQLSRSKSRCFCTPTTFWSANVANLLGLNLQEHVWQV